MAITFELVPEELGLRDPLFVGAFMGWPDASLGASGAVRYLVEKLNATLLAVWDGDEYYDFVELRPVSHVVPPRDRALIWPRGEFWIARKVPLTTSAAAGREAAGRVVIPGVPEAPDATDAEPAAAAGAAELPAPAARSLVLFLAHEPRLRWRAYARELAGLIKRCGATQAVFFGAAYADVPHTRPPIVTGWATEPRLRTRLEAAGVPFSAYQGPSSMQSAAIEVCRQEGIACASLFSNGPHYLPVPNANLSLALLRRLSAVFGLAVDLEPLAEAGAALTQQATAAMEDRTEFREHVRQLEAQFDAQAAPLAPGEVQRAAARAQAEASAPLNVDPQDVVRELEDFLRRRSRAQRPDEPGEGGEGGGPSRGEDDQPPGPSA
jgi:hypothetical protein